MADGSNTNRRVLARGTADLDGDGRAELVTVTGVPVDEGAYSRDMVLMIRNGFTGRTTSVRPPVSCNSRRAFTRFDSVSTCLKFAA